VFVIPAQIPEPGKLEQSWEPGSTADSRFTEEEMKQIRPRGSTPRRTQSSLKIDHPAPAAVSEAESRPNILFCISDDQSWLHTGAMGDPVVKTPSFDRIAREGILFAHAFCDAPSCAPSRSAILTGQHIWRLEEAGNIHSRLPDKFATYVGLLERAGYAIGSYSKAWSPGQFKTPSGWVHSGRTSMNPAGKRFASFEDFHRKKPKDKPFCFWLGSTDAHRAYKRDSGIQSGMDPTKVVVPAHLPDDPVVRRDILDYYFEVQRFDRLVGSALAVLERAGELDDTLVVVTSDNGMPFPRAKATLYDFGTRMPLAIRWPGKISSPGRRYDGFVLLSDMAPTFLEAAGLDPPAEMTARSLMRVFIEAEVAARDAAFTAMERHDGCRKGGKGYPCRAIRTHDFLYIRNYEPTRWPSGDPDARNCARAIPFGEVDSSPSKSLLMDNATQPGFRELHRLAFGKRPAEELYDLRSDPGQLDNIASRPDYEAIRRNQSERLERYTRKTGDPRALGKDAPWDYYPYYGVRRNKGWTVDKSAR
jgi:arylsulfatase A-like enzyme